MNFNIENLGKKYLILSYLKEDNITNNQNPNTELFNGNKGNDSTIFNSIDNNDKTWSDSINIPNIKVTNYNNNNPNDFSPITGAESLERFTSGVYLDDLIALQCLQYERNILNKLLSNSDSNIQLDPSDKNLIIKDKSNGQIKGFVSITGANLNNTDLEIRYVDVDDDARNVLKVLDKVNDNTGFIKFYENINFVKIPVDNKFILD